MKADLILAGGVVRTLGRSGLAPHSHLAVAGGVVIATGGDEVMGLRGTRTRVVDLEGASVLPGFNDAHAHVVYYGLTRFGADLSGTHSVAEIVGRLRDHGRSLKHGEWQQGMGYRAAELAEKQAPHRMELDRATGQILNNHNISIEEAFRGVVSRPPTPLPSVQPPPPAGQGNRP